MKSLRRVKSGLIGIALLGSMNANLSGHAEEISYQDALRSPIPEQWLYVPEHVQMAPTEDKWWKEFGDTTLNMLISKAEENNFNVASALKRIELANKELAITRSGYYPNLGVSAGWNRSQTPGAMDPKVGPSSVSTGYSAGLSMSWEIDVFGRIRRQMKADKAAIDVSRADYDAVMVSLCANLAKSYLQLRTYQMQREVALEHISSQEKVVKIAEARHEAGIGNKLAVNQAKTVLASTRSTLPGLEASIRTTANAIAILTGVYPAHLVPELLKPGVLPKDMGMPTVGVPVDLLRRRPDVVEAEAQLAQYAAMIGVAKNDFLPVLTLDGSIGTSARRLDNLFGKHSLSYSIAPTLSWTIFDGLSRNYKVAEAKIQLEQSVDNYNMTILNAVEEVENAITRYNAALQEVETLKETVVYSEEALRLALDTYKQGLSSMTDVVTSLQSYLQYQNSLVTARGETLAQLVSLYQAMGGGY